MNSSITVTCQVGSTNPVAKLGIEICLDGVIVYECEHVNFEATPVTFEVIDDENEHELSFILKNKTQDHTKIDEDGNIISDSNIIISDLAFDNIKLKHIVTKLATYSHDYNGSGPQTQSKFYGEMGCNGTVALRFSTPIYLWLLEHM